MSGVERARCLRAAGEGSTAGLAISEKRKRIVMHCCGLVYVSTAVILVLVFSALVATRKWQSGTLLGTEQEK